MNQMTMRSLLFGTYGSNTEGMFPRYSCILLISKQCNGEYLHGSNVTSLNSKLGYHFRNFQMKTGLMSYSPNYIGCWTANSNS